MEWNGHKKRALLSPFRSLLTLLSYIPIFAHDKALKLPSIAQFSSSAFIAAANFLQLPIDFLNCLDQTGIVKLHIDI